MLKNVWKHGKELLLEDNIKQTRVAKYEREERRQRINKLIVARVGVVGNSDMDLAVKEELEVEQATWTQHLMTLCPEFYS